MPVKKILENGAITINEILSASSFTASLEL